MLMAAQFHSDKDYLAKAEQLLQSIQALVPHAIALAWAARALELDARRIYEFTLGTQGNEATTRLDGLSDRTLQVYDKISSKEFLAVLSRRSLLRSSTLFAKAACLARGDDPSSIPQLAPIWRVAIDALPDLFRII